MPEMLSQEWSRSGSIADEMPGHFPGAQHVLLQQWLIFGIRALKARLRLVLQMAHPRLTFTGRCPWPHRKPPRAS